MATGMDASNEPTKLFGLLDSAASLVSGPPTQSSEFTLDPITAAGLHDEMALMISNPSLLGRLRTFSSKSFMAEKVGNYLVALSIGAYALLAFEKSHHFTWTMAESVLVKAQADDPARQAILKAHQLGRLLFGYKGGTSVLELRLNIAKAAWNEFYLATGYSPETSLVAVEEKLSPPNSDGFDTLRLGLRLLLSKKV